MNDQGHVVKEIKNGDCTVLICDDSCVPPEKVDEILENIAKIMYPVLQRSAD